MKVGMLIAMQNHPDDYHKDHELYWEECRLADLAESLGFDSLWAVEHHFDAYAMIPDVVQFLTYIAGRTSRIQLGTAVIVLPWHDPVRVAEQIAMLDILSRGRLLVGFGRGAAISPESVEVMARLGIGMLAILQRDWDSTVAEIERYNTFYRNLMGQEAMPPVVAARVIMGDTDEEARMLARRFIGGHWKMADQHYGITRGDHAGVNGYEHYAKMGAMLKQMDPEVMLDNTTAPHIYGTPETCLRRIRALRDKFRTNHFAAIFSDGGIPAEMAEKSIRRFAAEVLPELRRDEAEAAHTQSVQHVSK